MNQLLLEVPSEPHGARDGPSVRRSPWNVINGIFRGQAVCLVSETETITNGDGDGGRRGRGSDRAKPQGFRHPLAGIRARQLHDPGPVEILAGRADDAGEGPVHSRGGVRVRASQGHLHGGQRHQGAPRQVHERVQIPRVLAHADHVPVQAAPLAPRDGVRHPRRVPRGGMRRRPVLRLPHPIRVRHVRAERGGAGDPGTKVLGTKVRRVLQRPGQGGPHAAAGQAAHAGGG